MAVDTLHRMRIRRPRLLAVSLVVGLVVGVVVGLLVAGDGDGSDGGGSAIDARLSDPQAVVTFPNDGLGNDDVQGDPLPLVELTDRNGEIVEVADLLGQPLVVNFWYSTCVPCAKELPDFAEVHAEVGDRVRFIGVNTIDTVETMERFAGERGVRYELYRDELAELTDAIGATAFPITLFVTSAGTIVEQTGPIDADELRAHVDDLLAADPAVAPTGSAGSTGSGGS